MKRRIIAAEEDKATQAIDDTLATLKDDFDYAISGLEKLSRSGANASNEAMAIAETLGNNIQSTLNAIAGVVIE